MSPEHPAKEPQTPTQAADAVSLIFWVVLGVGGGALCLANDLVVLGVVLMLCGLLSVVWVLWVSAQERSGHSGRAWGVFAAIMVVLGAWTASQHIRNDRGE